MELRERIRAYMERENITQNQFGERCGLPQSTVSQIMRGADPRLSTVLKIEKTISEPHPARRASDAY